MLDVRPAKGLVPHLTNVSSPSGQARVAMPGSGEVSAVGRGERCPVVRPSWRLNNGF